MKRMRTLGVIGGMSAESTAIYYQKLNTGVRERLGGLHSAELLIYSVDFAPIAHLQKEGRWDEAGAHLADIALRLEKAGAEAIVLATNTMHKVIGAIESAVSIPVIHIADATGHAIRDAGLKRPGLLATAFTMEQEFYKGRLKDRYGLDVLVPDAAGRADTHRIIYDELCKGIVTKPSRQRYEDIAQDLVDQGADCIILGCTEVCMLLDATNVRVPVFDTVSIHVDAALQFALETKAFQ